MDNYVSQLEHIKRGDIAGAKKLSLRLGLLNKKNMEWASLDDTVVPEDSQGSHKSHSTVSSDGENYDKDNKQACWDSTQLTEAMSVLNEFLKKKAKKCNNCGFKNPKINKPAFGWFNVVCFICEQIIHILLTLWMPSVFPEVFLELLTTLFYFVICFYYIFNVLLCFSILNILHIHPLIFFVEVCGIEILS